MSHAIHDTAVVALDLENDLVDPEGSIGRAGLAAMVAERNVLDNAARVMAAARARGIPVLHVRVAFRADYADALSVAPRVAALKKSGAVVAGTWGTEFAPAVAPRNDELVFTKQSVNPFVSTGIGNWLLRHGVRDLVLFGVATNLVVESTARHADDLGFAVTVLEDCSASPNPAWHDFAVREILPMFGRVTDSRALLEEWRAQR